MVSLCAHLASIRFFRVMPYRSLPPWRTKSLQALLRYSTACFLTLGLFLNAHATDADKLLASWLSAQTNLNTWSADLIQTRTFKTLTQPLVARGHVWFVAPNTFRWELGQPPQTIAVRQPKQMLVIYPRLKRAERYPLDGEGAGPWRDALALFEAGFPRSRADLEAQFKIKLVQEVNGVCDVALEPKSSSVRRMMPDFRVLFEARDNSLRATELRFADGSTMRNDFTNAVINGGLDGELFTPSLPADFKMVQPGKGGSK
ncbi:MAG: outer membrane lipoprotein carrier protein LolA [Pedosphaera sp.]|nr:outer membrane lipoprotein carrier protein LolA [Pedosphaera sp.]